MRVLEALLVDLAGEQRVVRTGVLPPEVAYAVADAAAADARRIGGSCTTRVDVARTATGEWRVVQDLIDAPAASGTHC